MRCCCRRWRCDSAPQAASFIQIPPGPQADLCVSAARAVGLKEHPLAWAKFHRKTQNPPTVHTALAVREVGPEEADVFAPTAVAGFGMPAPMAAWLSRIVGRPHWHAYVSFDGTTPAGAGALYVKGNFAWLGIGATKAEFRRPCLPSSLPRPSRLANLVGP
jgi:hypothetical protein